MLRVRTQNSGVERGIQPECRQRECKIDGPNALRTAEKGTCMASQHTPVFRIHRIGLSRRMRVLYLGSDQQTDIFISIFKSERTTAHDEARDATVPGGALPDVGKKASRKRIHWQRARLLSQTLLHRCSVRARDCG